MTASLFGDRYFGRKAAWHTMGVVMDRPVTAIEAISLARLDYTVATTQAFFRVADAADPDGEELEIPVSDQVAIYRSPTPDDPYVRSFGMASRGFTLVQNTELAQILDPMTREWPVETAGALKQGEVVWMLLDMGEGVIAGEQHRRFAWVRNSHTPGQGLMFKPVRTRVVCANTDAVAMNEKGVVISLRHSRGVAERFDEVIKAMDQLKAQNALDEQALEALAAYTMTSDEVERVVNAIYKLPDPPKFRTVNGLPSEKQAALRAATERQYELNLARMQRYQSEYVETAETFAIMHPKLAKTAYATYQVVLECEQYRRATAANAVSAFFGQGYEVTKLAKLALVDLVK